MPTISTNSDETPAEDASDISRSGLEPEGVAWGSRCVRAAKDPNQDSSEIE